MSPWKRTFVCAFLAQILSMTGFAAVLPFLPFFIEELGITDKADQAWWAGIVMSAAAVTLAVFAPVWGLLADRFGRRVMVMRAMFAGTVVLLLMSCVQTIGQLVFCRLLQGALTGTVAASVALVASVSPQKRTGFTMGMMQTAVFIGVALGPLAGGVVADHLGYRTAFRVGALIVFLGGLLVYYGTMESFAPSDPEHIEHRRSFKQIILHPGFLAAVFILFSIRFSNTMSNPAFPLIVKELRQNTGMLATVTGSIVFCAALAGAVSAGVLGHFGDSWGHKRVLLTCSLAASVVSVAHAPVQSITHLVILRTLFGLSIAGMIPAANALIRRTTHDSNIGKAYGAATSLSMLGMALGPFLGGCLCGVQPLEMRTPFVVMGIGQLVVAVIVTLFVREQDVAAGVVNGDARA